MSSSDNNDASEEIFVVVSEKSGSGASKSKKAATDPDVLIVDTGDSIKVKQTFDDAISDIMGDYQPPDGNSKPYKQNTISENFKMIIMFTSCLLGLLAQFYPLPFPDNLPLAALCAAGYFAICTLYQYFVFLVEKDIICRYSAPDGSIIIFRSAFPRFQEHYSIVLQRMEGSGSGSGSKGGSKSMLSMLFGAGGINPPANEAMSVAAELYVGNYFTERGEFYEEGFRADLLQLVGLYMEKQYGTHKISSGRGVGGKESKKHQ